MATNLTLASIKSTGGTASRTIGDRLADIINVKDYGAKGDGIHDDTANIQAAFDAAFGTWASPHAVANTLLNKAVFFPNGTYNVNPLRGLLTVTSCVSSSGLIELGFSAAHGLTNGDNVYVRAVTGTTEANGTWWVTVVDSTHITLNNSVFTNAWISGGTVGTPCLRIRGTQGAKIFGAGRIATTILSGTAGASVLHLNGWGYGKICDLAILAPNGLALDLNWDNIAPISTQGNLLSHLWLGASNRCDYALTIGLNGAMCSETELLSCQIQGADTAGILIGNANATNNSMFGGQVQGCVVGILAKGGGDFETIHGVSFENSPVGQTYDIQIINSAGTGYSILSCRSESASGFVGCGVVIGIHIENCWQAGGTGAFFQGSGYVTIANCKSASGFIGGNPILTLNNNDFGAGYLSNGAANYMYLKQDPIPITSQTGSSYTFTLADLGSKVQFNRSSAQTITIPAFQFVGYTGYNNLGTKIEVQQIGTGQVTFQGATGVTIRSSNGLKLRAQNSVAILTNDSNDGAGNVVWTLSGDTTT